MNGPLIERLETEPALRSVTVMFPGETSEPERPAQAGNAVELATAFSEFIAVSARLEGSYRQLQDEVTALRLELGAQNAALKQSLAQNKRMHLHLQQIVDSMPCGVLVIDQDGILSMINPESLRLLALDRDILSSIKSISLQDISALSGINLQAWYQGPSSGQVSQEFCLQNATGKRWIEVRNRRLDRQQGEVNDLDHTIFILRDVTAQRRDEQERIAGRKAMALAEMTTILAHEIRNPLASLELFAELIENDPDHRAAWISNLRAGIRSLSATANNVLTFHGSGALQLAPLRLFTLIEKAVDFVQPLADQAAVSLQCADVEDESLVLGNDCALQQVVLNLVSNAIRHTPQGGRVSISMRRAGNGEVLVEFADTGCGIQPEQMQHIFEPGFSGRGDTSGLGLAVCRQIMKQHHGTITVAPCRAAGARFELRFPSLAVEVATA